VASKNEWKKGTVKEASKYEIVGEVKNITSHCHPRNYKTSLKSKEGPAPLLSLQQFMIAVMCA